VQRAVADPAQALVDGVGEGEGVQGRVPVAELVAGVEAGDAQRRRVGHDPGDIGLGAAFPQGGQQAVGDVLGRIAEQDGDQLVAGGRFLPPGLAAPDGRGQPLKRPLQNFHQVDRAAPGVGFFHALGAGVGRDQAGQDRLRVLPAGDVQGLEGFVGKVQDVPGGQVAVVGGGGEEHVGHLAAAGPGADGRGQAALRAFGVAHLHELAEPAAQRGDVRVQAGQRAHREARRATGRIAGDGRQPVIQGARAVVMVQAGQDVHQAGEDGQALAPARLAVGRAKLQADAERVNRVAALALQQGDHGLGDDQRQVALQPVAQAVAGVLAGVGRRGDVHPDRAVARLGRVDARVIRPEVERPAAGQVKAGVMPVAGQDAILDRAPVEGEAHMRAAIVDGVDGVAMLEQGQRVAPHADGQAAARGGPQILQTGGEDELRPGG